MGRSSYDYVLIWEGTNDINGSTITPTAYGTNVQTQITAAKPYLRANGKIILIPPGTPPVGTNSQGLNLAACASQLSTLAANDPNNVVFAASGTGMFFSA
jgi:lysophospholipase L1-like esterase